MKILVVGSGAREHAIVRALNREGGHELFVVGGNPGIWELAEQAQLGGINVGELEGENIARWCSENAVELCIVGPEAPLAVGVVDEVLANSETAVFGPTKEAAKIEASKSFAKDVMFKAGVPTAGMVKCENMTELVAGLAESDSSAPFVVKADGLAAGKGVIVTTSKAEAEAHASTVFKSGGFVILEEYLAGPEFSEFFICDGETAVALQPAQDFKRIYDGDLGPNTGGMGSYTLLDWLPADLLERTTAEIAQPVLDEMKSRGCPFVGVLFAGLVLTESGVKVIEFNCRFGDPETQVVLESLQSPLSELLLRAARGYKSDGFGGSLPHLKWSADYFCNVVLAAKNYPDTPQKGDIISGVKAAEAKGAVVLEAGTAYAPSDVDQIVTNGGRVLSVIQKASTLKEARERAYNAAEKISWDGMQYRRDIALKAVNGEI